MLAYFRGESSAELMIRRDDGLEDAVPVSHFFREPAEFSPIERAALERCRGHILDIGAGSGLHALSAQSRGFTVTAIDMSHHAVEIMIRRGVHDARCADIFAFFSGPFETLLMLGHGIGMVESLQGLDRFLAHAHGLASRDGQLLLHSVDVRRTDDPRHLAYHEANRQAGRYIGTIRIQFEYRGHTGPPCDWLHVDPETLTERADRAGWVAELVRVEESGEYLARLSRSTPAPRS